MRANEVSQLLSQRADEVARYLLPNGKMVGHEWKVGSVSGEPGKSLCVNVHGNQPGIWKDFASDEKGGDLLDLWCQVRNVSLAEAISEAKSYLGVGRVDFAPQRASRFVKPALVGCQPLSESSGVMKYLTEERQLSEDTLSKFNIRGQGRDIVFPYYRGEEIVFVKYLSIDRHEGRKAIRVEKDCEPSLFGWQAVAPSARQIVLCEGEIDAMTLQQYGFDALSVPFGAGIGGKHRWLEYEFDRLAIFDEIILCFDQDEEGQKAVNELLDRLGRHRCRVVDLPHKDPNACLQDGVSAEQMRQLFANAKSFDPVELKSASLYASQVIDEFYPPSGVSPGIHLPWQRAYGKVMLRPEELSVWTGTNGHGKSQLLGQVVLSAMSQGARVCIASLELKPRRLLMRLTRQAAAIAKPSEPYIHAIHDWYQEKLWIFDLVGTAKTDRLLEVFLYARQRYMVDMFVIDSFMKCGIAEDDYRAQKQFVEQLCDFKNQYGCHIHLVIHPRKGQDESRPPGKIDIKGSGSVTDLADNCFSVWRNKGKESQVQRCKLKNEEVSREVLEKIDCLVICDKQRNGDWEGRVGLWFDPDSYQYLNSYAQRPTRYVDFSMTNEGMS